MFWEWRNIRFYVKLLTVGGMLFPWETGNLDPNISDSSKLYFLVIIKTEERNIFLVIRVLGMMVGALTFIN